MASVLRLSKLSFIILVVSVKEFVENRKPQMAKKFASRAINKNGWNISNQASRAGLGTSTAVSKSARQVWRIFQFLQTAAS